MKKIKGFTLLEMLLVMVIMSVVIVMLIGYTSQKMEELRRDKGAMQMQQILNAALTYYVNNSKWPLPDASCQNGAAPVPLLGSLLQTANYLPPGPINSPWGQAYSISCNNATGNFYVTTNTVGADSETSAQILAGRLPLAFVSDNKGSSSNPPTQGNCTDTTVTNPACAYIVSAVTIPGQNLNNARSVNFASVYHSGDCVPAPSCPPNMKPAIYVVPASVSGMYDPPTNCSGTGYPWSTDSCVGQVIPVSNFNAYATGNANGDPVPASSGGPAPGPNACNAAIGPEGCDFGTNVDPSGTKYWRACLAVTTEKGLIIPNSFHEHGKMMGSVLAITRCVPNQGNETPSGSDFNVWTGPG